MEAFMLALEALFASTNWTNRNITTTYNNVDGLISEGTTEFIRVSVLPGGAARAAFGGITRTSGSVIIQIFVEVGEGTKRAYEIAGFLDSLVDNVSLSNGQLSPGYLNIVGRDRDNPSLFQANYTLNFTHRS